jgi:hypothetical protein
MPTLRKFFKHVAPRIMGSSTSRSRSNANSYAVNRSGHAAVLSRSRKHGNEYDHFDCDNEMQIFDSPLRREKGGSPDQGTTSVTVDAHSAAEDSHSDKAILQTKSFTVQYD